MSGVEHQSINQSINIDFFYRDLRLQRDLGVRYDTRDNVFDWDYHMRLIEREVNIWCLFLIWKLKTIWVKKIYQKVVSVKGEDT